jgi:hypothetical protein
MLGSLVFHYILESVALVLRFTSVVSDPSAEVQRFGLAWFYY